MQNLQELLSSTWLGLALSFVILGTVGSRLFRAVVRTTDASYGEIRTRLENVQISTSVEDKPAPATESGKESTAQSSGRPIFDDQLGREVLNELRRARVERREGDVRTYKVLTEYSAQGLSQSQTSFRVSLVAAGLGFLVILVGVAVALFSKDASSSGALLTIASGAVVDAVSILFFTISTRSQKTMVDFFDKLREDRKLEEALLLVKGVPDPVMASRLQVLLALQFTQVADLAQLYRQTVGEPPGLTRNIDEIADGPV